MCRPLRSLCRSVSFAPSELVSSHPTSHGLRRGLHSFAASRLGSRTYSKRRRFRQLVPKLFNSKKDGPCGPSCFRLMVGGLV